MFHRDSLCSFVMCFSVLCLGGALMAEDVSIDRDELTSIGDQSTRFINYVGPYEFTNTLDQIEEIGRSLGRQLEPSRSGNASIGNKYRVVRIVSPEIPIGLDADVFILESDAAVDHINNLRIIVAAYLEYSYGLPESDAYLVAEFVSYYNAVYRKDIEMAKNRYKVPVVAALNPEKLGLDTHFSNWAGRTQMLIPLRLSQFLGDQTSPMVDTGAISDDQVIEEMRKEEDMGLESRRGMVDLREREIAEELKALDREREAVQSLEETVGDELRSLERREDAGGELSQAEGQKKEALEKKRADAEEKKAVVAKKQKELNRRTDEVLAMRDDIAADENKRMEEQDRKETLVPEIAPVWFLLVDNKGGGIPYGRVVKHNLNDGARLATSELTAVRGRTLVALPESLLVIAGKKGGRSKVRPMLLDRKTLKTIKEGADDVFPGSLISLRGSDIYLITTKGGEWRLGKFNTALERTAVSERAVDAWTSIFFDDTSVFVQSETGEILKLSASTLKEEAELE